MKKYAAITLDNKQISINFNNHTSNIMNICYLYKKLQI